MRHLLWGLAVVGSALLGMTTNEARAEQGGEGLAASNFQPRDNVQTGDVQTGDKVQFVQYRRGWGYGYGYRPYYRSYRYSYPYRYYSYRPYYYPRYYGYYPRYYGYSPRYYGYYPYRSYRYGYRPGIRIWW